MNKTRLKALVTTLERVARMEGSPSQEKWLCDEQNLRLDYERYKDIDAVEDFIGRGFKANLCAWIGFSRDWRSAGGRFEANTGAPAYEGAVGYGAVLKWLQITDDPISWDVMFLLTGDSKPIYDPETGVTEQFSQMYNCPTWRIPPQALADNLKMMI